MLFLLVPTLLLFVLGGLLSGPQKEWVKMALPMGNLDLYAHVLFCALLGFLGWLAGLRWWILVIAIMGLGFFIEGLQFWIPGRSPSWSDVMDNAAGLAGGMLFAWLVFNGNTRGDDG